MNKHLVILLILVAVSLVAPLGNKAYAQSGDLCGGTGGNGEIVSAGINTFTLKLNEGDSLIVNLTSRTAIETPVGAAALSDLKIGDRVTLVGDNHRDGTFTVDAVVLCGAAQADPLTVRNKSPEAYEKVNGMVRTGTFLLFGSIWFGMCAFFLLKKKKGLVYILFFTVFYVYAYKVLDYTLLQFQSLLIVQHFVPDLMLNGFKDGTNVNLIPLATLTLEDVKTSLLNILMMVPFGFGLPFISNLRIKRVVLVGLLVSVGIEFLQFATGFMADTTFRVADINDLIFNTVGVGAGYVLFAQFVLVYRRISRPWKVKANSILRYIAERPQIDTRDE